MPVTVEGQDDCVVGRIREDLAHERGLDVVSHGGSRAGYGLSIRIVPSKKFGVIAVANRTGIGLNATVEKATQIALSLQPSSGATAAAAASGRASRC